MRSSTAIASQTLQSRRLGVRGASTATALLVRPAVAVTQLDADAAEAAARAEASGGAGTSTTTYAPTHPNGSMNEHGGATTVTPTPLAPTRPQLTRFYGTKSLEPTRLMRDADDIAKEVLQHLTRLLGAQVDVTIEIQARLPEGASEETIRTVTENCRTLGFRDFGFEEG